MHDTYIYLKNNTHYSEAHEIEKLSKIPLLSILARRPSPAPHPFLTSSLSSWRLLPRGNCAPLIFSLNQDWNYQRCNSTLLFMSISSQLFTWLRSRSSIKKNLDSGTLSCCSLRAISASTFEKKIVTRSHNLRSVPFRLLTFPRHLIFVIFGTPPHYLGL